MIITRKIVARKLRTERNFDRTFPQWKRTPEVLRNEVLDSLFESFAWPGGYPLEYVSEDGSVLCAECARTEVIEERRKVTSGTYMEGPTIQCDGCQTEIESAYGDPDEGKEDDDETALNDIVGDLVADGMDPIKARDLAQQQIAENANALRRMKGV